ncbi:membrane protein YqaA with SNARE-associated domain [Hydrogenivirga caldilitoris]|uniref:Membrane protein YqaA with SNARE-associated domain n=1 Tax=Hydrogenivirga caldilitoris TaxID=246264 RepID=A0A497XSJ2_9AQUI|nr:YqaA family protein [Hydrogenivirga caldilitoris]RLJ70102.1 membrane protein YqaA with SNARE-associated domain [Hydrogenivirga caldilitoris]
MFESLELWAKNLVEHYGYIGIFLISFSESIVQPVPPDPFIAGGTALGLNPLIASLVATLGSVLGGLTAHTLGLIFGEPLTKKLLGEKNFLKGEAFMNRYGVFAVLLGALTPVPFKAICWLAGIFEMPRIPFLLAAFIGRLPRFLVFAYMGSMFGY